MIMACDGLWDVLTDDEAVHQVISHGLTSDPLAAAIHLRDFAYRNGSTDNISVVMVRFKHYLEDNRGLRSALGIVMEGHPHPEEEEAVRRLSSDENAEASAEERLHVTEEDDPTTPAVRSKSAPVAEAATAASVANDGGELSSKKVQQLQHASAVSSDSGAGGAAEKVSPMSPTSRDADAPLLRESGN